MSVDHETFQLLKQSIHRFVRERLVPVEDRVEEQDEVPSDIIEDMGGWGFLGSRSQRNMAASDSQWPKSVKSPMSLARRL